MKYIHNYSTNYIKNQWVEHVISRKHRRLRKNNKNDMKETSYTQGQLVWREGSRREGLFYCVPMILDLIV